MKLGSVFAGPPMQPFRRFAAILISVCVVDCVVVWFAKKPLPWAAIIPAFVPLLVVVLVVIPMMRASTTRSKG